MLRNLLSNLFKIKRILHIFIISTWKANTKSLFSHRSVLHLIPYRLAVVINTINRWLDCELSVAEQNVLFSISVNPHWCSPSNLKLIIKRSIFSQIYQSMFWNLKTDAYSSLLGKYQYLNFISCFWSPMWVTKVNIWSMNVMTEEYFIGLEPAVFEATSISFPLPCWTVSMLAESLECWLFDSWYFLFSCIAHEITDLTYHQIWPWVLTAKTS